MPPTTLRERVGARVRELRESLPMAQDEFAAFIQLDRSYYGRVERGEANPSLSVLERIADGLGVAVRELFP